jgi:chemotaxis signal transduction protein
LSLCTRLRPDVVLLDLSMPEMDGEQVLAHLKANPELEPIPVVIISSERARAEACLARGAAAHLVKPVRAEELVTVVAHALEIARQRAARGSLNVLPLGVGALELAVPLIDVRHVIWMTATRPLPGGPSYLQSFFEHHAEPICMLDLAARFGVEHTEHILERKLVIVERDGVKLGLCADRVQDPEEILPANIKPIGDNDSMDGAIMSLVKMTRGSIPVVRPHALLSRGLVRSLSAMLIKEIM